MKKSSVAGAVLCTAFLLNGCGGYTEIENMDILTSHFVSLSDDKVCIGGGVANIRDFSDSSGPVSFISASGDSLPDAVSALERSADHKLFYGGMRAVVIGDLYAREGVGEFMRYLRSEQNQRMSVDVFTSESEPKEIVKYKAVNDFSGGFAAESLIHSLEERGLAVRTTLGDVMTAAAEGSVGFAVPNILIEDEIMRINGYSIFDGERKVGFLGEQYSLPLCCFLGVRASESCLVDIKQRSGVIEADMLSRRIYVEEDLDGRLCVSADFTFNLTAADIESGGLAPKEEETVKKQVKAQLCGTIESVLELSKDYGCDFLGLYKIYQKKHRAKFYNTDWRTAVSDMRYSVCVNIGKFENKLTNEEIWR